MMDFSEIAGTFSELNPKHPHENISNFKKHISRLSGAYREPRTIGQTLSLKNLNRNLSPRTLNRTFEDEDFGKDLEKDQLN